MTNNPFPPSRQQAARARCEAYESTYSQAVAGAITVGELDIADDDFRRAAREDIPLMLDQLAADRERIRVLEAELKRHPATVDLASIREPLFGCRDIPRYIREPGGKFTIKVALPDGSVWEFAGAACVVTPKATADYVTHVDDEGNAGVVVTGVHPRIDAAVAREEST